MSDENPNTLGLNLFGEVLWEIMVSKGVTSWSELAEKVTEDGYPVTVEEIYERTHYAQDVCRITEDS